MSKHLSPIQNRILKVIYDLQEGNYNKVDKVRFDHSVTGHGVTLFAMANYLLDIKPEVVVQEIKQLADKGLIAVYDQNGVSTSDATGFVSFRVINGLKL